MIIKKNNNNTINSHNNNDNSKEKEKFELNKILDELKDIIIEDIKNYFKNDFKTETMR